jgi:hypothetical protein
MNQSVIHFANNRVPVAHQAQVLCSRATPPRSCVRFEGAKLDGSAPTSKQAADCPANHRARAFGAACTKGELDLLNRKAVVLLSSHCVLKGNAADLGSRYRRFETKNPS